MDILSILEETLPSVNPIEKAKEDLLAKKHQTYISHKKMNLERLFRDCDENFVRSVMKSLEVVDAYNFTIKLPNHHELNVQMPDNWPVFFMTKKEIRKTWFGRKKVHVERKHIYCNSNIVEALIECEIH